MENVRAFFDDAEDIDSCVEAISNKLLTLLQDSQKLYAKMIVTSSEAWLADLRTKEVTCGVCIDGTPSIDAEAVAYHAFSIDCFSFINRVSQVFDFAKISLKKNAADLKCNEFYRLAQISPEHFQELKESANDKMKVATHAQRWAIIRNLMECAVDWRLTTDEDKLMYNKTDIARFLSFLCGGSEDRIRKHLEDELPAKGIKEIIPYLENIGLHEISNRIKSI